MNISRLRHQVGQVIAANQLWGTGTRVLVAVSGGLDSVCLLDLLVQTAKWHGAKLEVATVDHGTRGESAADADFVAALAIAQDLPFHRFDLALGPNASEAVCREARYGVLRSVGAERIALAHHQDDQAVTAMLMLMRGTGLRGVTAMPLRRDDLVRPLLGVSQEQLGQWAHFRGLQWREDPTNDDRRFTRNQLRHEVMPILERIRPGATAAMARAADRLRSDADLLDEMAREHSGPPWSSRFVARGPIAIVERVLMAATGVERRHVSAIRRAAEVGAGRVTLPDGRAAVVDGAVVVIVEL